MAFFRYLLILLAFLFPVFPCPGKLEFYELLSQAERSYIAGDYKKAVEIYSELDGCESFTNTEKHLYYYARAIYKTCDNEDTGECLNLIKKGIKFLTQAIQMLRPENAFRKELSERYHLLGFLYLKIHACRESRKALEKSLHFYYNDSVKKDLEQVRNWCSF